MRETATLTTVEELLAEARAEIDRLSPRRDRRLILICDEGYQSSLAAATLRRFDLEACDVIGGVQGWKAAGLPLEDPGT